MIFKKDMTEHSPSDFGLSVLTWWLNVAGFSGKRREPCLYLRSQPCDSPTELLGCGSIGGLKHLEPVTASPSP